MKNLRKVIACLLALVLALGCLAGCGSSQPAASTDAAQQEPAASGSEDQAPAAAEQSEEAPKNIKLVYANHQLAESAGTEEALNKMIAKYLEINEVGVTDIEVINPGNEYAVYYQSQFMGGTQPDIGSGLMGQVHEYYANGLVLDMTPYYAQKTPYVGDGSLTWEESMSNNLLIQEVTPTGANPCIPYAIGANKLVYNPELLAQYNLEPPTTWAEFMACCESIEAQGGDAIGYAARGSSDGSLHWAMRVIMDSVASAELEKIDTDGSYFIDLAEWCEAVNNGTVDFTQEPWLSTYSILQDYSKYWYEGSTAMSNTDIVEKFAKGEVVFLQCAIWMLKNLISNPERTFDPEVVRMPALTTETSPYADGLYHNLGGLPNANYWISSSLEGDKLAAAVDFCMFLTGEYCAKIEADDQLMIPVVDPQYMPATEGPVGKFGLDYEISRIALYDATLGTEFFDSIYTDVQPMIIGSSTPEQAAAAQQASLQAAVAKIMADNGWTAENNYGRG